MDPEPEIADPDQADKPPTGATAADKPPSDEATAGADKPRTPRASDSRSHPEPFNVQGGEAPNGGRASN